MDVFEFIETCYGRRKLGEEAGGWRGTMLAGKDTRMLLGGGLLEESRNDDDVDGGEKQEDANDSQDDDRRF